MRAVAFDIYNDHYILANRPTKKLTEKNGKRRFLVKLKRKHHSFIEPKSCSHSKKSEEKINNKNYKLLNIPRGSDQIEECIFYYADGIIQMTTLPKSAN